MKRILIAFGLLTGLTGYAHSQAGVQIVHEVAQSTSSIIQTINLCNTGPVDVAVATSSGTLAGHFALEVYNPTASTNTVNCAFDISVSTNIYSVWYGREIFAGGSVLWQKLSNRKLWCLTQNSGGCTRVTITQMK